jgi:hypothetical protein
MGHLCFLLCKVQKCKWKYNFNSELYTIFLEVQFNFVFELLQINDKKVIFTTYMKISCQNPT